MIDVHALLGSAVGGLAVTAGFWAGSKYLPSLFIGKIHAGFEAAKNSAWWKDPAHPKRARLLLAAAEFFEDEIPNPGDGQAVYDTFGVWAHTHLIVGSEKQWASAGRTFGDAVDTELGTEIKELAAPSAAAPQIPQA